jgi:hypothetical protein
MAQELLVTTVILVMTCVIWQGMYGSGQTVVFTRIASQVIALSAAAAGIQTGTSVLSHTGPATSRSAAATALDFGFVVECFFAWIFINPLHYYRLHFGTGE